MNRYALFCLVALLVLVPQLKTQDPKRWFESPEAFFAASTEVRNPSSSAVTANGGFAKMGGGTREISSNLPGDYPLGVLVSSGQFARYGDTYRVDFISSESTGRVSIYGRLFWPNAKQVQYFSAESGVLPGFFPKGLSKNEVVHIWERKLTNDFWPGEYQLDISVFDDETGTLKQQLFTRFYLHDVGVSGQISFGPKRATVAPGTVFLEGSFPRGQILSYVGSGTAGFFSDFNLVSTDGAGIFRIPVRFGSNADLIVVDRKSVV